MIWKLYELRLKDFWQSNLWRGWYVTMSPKGDGKEARKPKAASPKKWAAKKSTGKKEEVVARIA